MPIKHACDANGAERRMSSEDLKAGSRVLCQCPLLLLKSPPGDGTTFRKLVQDTTIRVQGDVGKVGTEDGQPEVTVVLLQC